VPNIVPTEGLTFQDRDDAPTRAPGPAPAGDADLEKATADFKNGVLLGQDAERMLASKAGLGLVSVGERARRQAHGVSWSGRFRVPD
jgi:hypothetical protein